MKLENLRIIYSNRKNQNNIFFNKFSIDIPNIINLSVFFLYCSWSPTIINYQLLLDALLNYPEVDIHVFDIDEPNFVKYNDSIRSNGWGEIYFVRDGKVVSEINKNVTVELIVEVVNKFTS